MRAMFLPLALVLSAYVAVAGADCAGPMDCNAKECYDCTCTNGQCSCGDGWSGQQCDTPFCVNRTEGCSGHGNCQQSLHNPALEIQLFLLDHVAPKQHAQEKVSSLHGRLPCLPKAKG